MISWNGSMAGSMPPVTLAYSGSTARAPSLLICLPATEPGQPTIAWPGGYALERVKVGAAAAYG